MKAVHKLVNGSPFSVIREKLTRNSEQRTENQIGFTLVELLVVIAVIAVIAAIVVAAINPLEQIRRGRDAQVKQDVGVISRALEAYFTAGAGTGGANIYPASLTAMTGTGDLKIVPTPPTDAGSAYGYARNGSSDAAAVWATIQSTKDHNAAGCDPTSTLLWGYSSAGAEAGYGPCNSTSLLP